MKEFIEKLIGRLEEYPTYSFGVSLLNTQEYIKVSDLIEIVNQLAEEYNNDIVNQLAMKYAKWLTKCGVNVTEKWITATEQAYALNKAYIRGIQDERDRFAKWQDEYNNGWIPCSVRLPEKYGEYLCCDTYGNFVLGFPSESDTSDTGFIVETEYEYCYDIIAWMELPKKYQKGE